MFVSHFAQSFFTTVQYDPDAQDSSLAAKAEAAADMCRAPGRWFVSEVLGGGKKLTVEVATDLTLNVEAKKKSQGLQKAVRIALGFFLGIPGQILSIPLMGMAYFSKEIRMKHLFTVRTLSDGEKTELKDLITSRQELAKQRQGCEPVSCLLCTICCLLCYLVCKKKDINV